LKTFFLLPVLFFFQPAAGQSPWKQSLRYDLHVILKEPDHSLDATMTLVYTNHSPDTLSYIWFHVWPNAYRNDRTSYSEQRLENGDTRFYFSAKEQKGYINRLDFHVNGLPALIQDHPEYIDVIKLLLPKSLLPGDSLSIAASFHVRLPYNFDGNGYLRQHFEIRNWYPEPAVYDNHGWHPMPFLLQGGAYHESGDYRVEIEAPPAYRIASGSLADTMTTSQSANRYQFSLQQANGFAWIADKSFKVKTDTLLLSNGRPVSIQYFYTSDPFHQIDQIFQAAKKNIRQLSLWLTPYPYRAITLVQTKSPVDESFSGLVCIGPKDFPANVYNNIRGAVLGQWFQTILLSDQRTVPWLSKAFIPYYKQRLLQLSPPKYAEQLPFQADQLWLRVAEQEKTTQPISTPSPEFSTGNDSLIPATKGGLWLDELQETVGKNTFDQNIHAYFEHWKFDHPYPEDFEKIMDTELVHKTQLFDQLNGNKSLFRKAPKRILRPAFIFSAKNSTNYNYVGLAPVAAYNRYDDFMLGAVIHNYNLPPNAFEFLFSPLYAFGSKKFEGLGRLSYSLYPDITFSKITIGLNGDLFSSNKATDSTGKNIFENFSKLVPYARVEFKPRNPRSPIREWMDFKSYLINEKTFTQYAPSSKDSLIHPNAVGSSLRYVNQLRIGLQNNRALYPYDAQLAFQQSELFYRINLRANYFFNYPDGGGLCVRFFAAKFGVWNNHSVADVSRYEPKLLGVSGEEDYLYESYFIGRAASDAIENSSVSNGGIAARQIMNRDGGLKLRIDAYDYVQGRSANWVTAINLNTSLPANLFPFPLPLRLFFDVGTYAEAWEDNPSTSRFLYTGGIQLCLFKNILNIYAPIVYSHDFKEALTSTSFGRRITFSIDIQNIRTNSVLKKILPNHE